MLGAPTAGLTCMMTQYVVYLLNLLLYRTIIFLEVNAAP